MRLTGAKPPLRPKHVWSIRTKLQIEGRSRDLAMLNRAIDSKLRGCDVVAIRVEDVAAGVAEATVKRISRTLNFQGGDVQQAKTAGVNRGNIACSMSSLTPLAEVIGRIAYVRSGPIVLKKVLRGAHAYFVKQLMGVDAVRCGGPRQSTQARSAILLDLRRTPLLQSSPRVDLSKIFAVALLSTFSTESANCRHAPGMELSNQAAGFRALSGERRLVERRTGYCPWCALIFSSISLFTASRLKLAGACIGG